jgi:hypothetical protein
MKIKSALLGATLAGLVVLGGSAKADVLTVGGGWDPFGFGGVGSSFSTDFQFTVSQTVDFKVTDGYLDGDQFAISINGGPSTNTSVPTNDGTQLGSNFDAAFASPLFSHGSYILGPGTYDVTGTVVLSPYGSGGAAAQLSAVPEASTWVMMLAGFAGLGFIGYRRNKAASTAA